MSVEHETHIPTATQEAHYIFDDFFIRDVSILSVGVKPFERLGARVGFLEPCERDGIGHQRYDMLCGPDVFACLNRHLADGNASADDHQRTAPGCGRHGTFPGQVPRIYLTPWR